MMEGREKSFVGRWFAFGVHVRVGVNARGIEVKVGREIPGTSGEGLTDRWIRLASWSDDACATPARRETALLSRKGSTLLSRLQLPTRVQSKLRRHGTFLH